MPSDSAAQITGLRNRLIHGYESVDLNVLWRILADDLPQLVVELEPVVETGGPR
jgi:uncharacterized protein with HEPN domain